MKRVYLLLLLVPLIWGMSTTAATQAAEAVVLTPPAAPVADAPQAGPTPTVNEDGEPVSALGKERISLRERRRLGLTLPNMVRVAKQLKDEGRLTAETSRAEAAALIFMSIVPKEEVKLHADWDWQAILDFIEALIPLILLLIEIFAVPVVAGGIVLGGVASQWRRVRCFFELQSC